MTHPNQSIAGHRVLGGWWAAQHFDSALIRGLACLDRLAILLHCAAGKPFDRDRQTKELRLPAFRTNYLQALADAYDPTRGDKLTALLDHEIFKLVSDTATASCTSDVSQWSYTANTQMLTTLRPAAAKCSRPTSISLL